MVSLNDITLALGNVIAHNLIYQKREYQPTFRAS